MTSPTIEFLFDFGSPNAYLAWKVTGDLAERVGARLVLRPVLLGGVFKATNNTSPIVAFAKVSGKLAYERLEISRYVRYHQLSAFQFNSHFPINTLTLMRGAVYAEDQGFLDAYAACCFAAMWEDNVNMGDEPEALRVLDQAGLDGEAILNATRQDAIKEGLKDRTSAAVERGVFGVPTFFVGQEMFFGKERVTQVEAELLNAVSQSADT